MTVGLLESLTSAAEPEACQLAEASAVEMRSRAISEWKRSEPLQSVCEQRKHPNGQQAC